MRSVSHSAKIVVSLSLKTHYYVTMWASESMHNTHTKSPECENDMLSSSGYNYYSRKNHNSSLFITNLFCLLDKIFVFILLSKADRKLVHATRLSVFFIISRSDSNHLMSSLTYCHLHSSPVSIVLVKRIGYKTESMLIFTKTSCYQNKQGSHVSALTKLQNSLRSPSSRHPVH